MPLSTIFQLYRDGYQRKPPTCRTSLTNFIISGIRTDNIIVVICTDYTVSCKSN